MPKGLTESSVNHIPHVITPPASHVKRHLRPPDTVMQEGK